MKIYVEDGALTPFVKTLWKQGIQLYGFHFESKTKKYIRSDKPSRLTMDSTFVNCGDDKITIGATEESKKFGEIAKIIGKNHFNDIRHVDTAYKEGCVIFLTPDKGDIIKKSVELEAVTGIKFIHCREDAEIQNAINTVRAKE